MFSCHEPRSVARAKIIYLASECNDEAKTYIVDWGSNKAHLLQEVDKNVSLPKKTQEVALKCSNVVNFSINEQK